MPPGQPFLVQSVSTMDQNIEQHLLHHVPTELAIYQSELPTPSEVSEGEQCVHVAIHRKFKTP
jgi:hypothetical protein